MRVVFFAVNGTYTTRGYKKHVSNKFITYVLFVVHSHRSWYISCVVIQVSIMMIEKKIGQSILHQQKDMIAKHLGQIREIIHENYAREDLLINNENSPHNGEFGVYVRLEYSN